jgi:hypothetical protein
MLKYNPFRPGSIIHSGMFAGRFEEMAGLEQILYQTLNGNPSHFLIHGERGIGKSSLLLLLSHIARGTITSFDKKKFNFLTINLVLEPNDTYSDIVQKAARELQREINKSDNTKKLLKDVWGFITNWEVMGVKYKHDQVPAEIMLEELAEKLCVVAEKLRSTQSGVYVFIDEADKPTAEANLGAFTKVLTERLTKRDCSNVGLGIVGISDVIPKMRHSHESSVRILTPFKLGTLLPEERKDVVRKGLLEAEQKNGFKVGISDDALNMLSNVSEGYPHFIQQYAYSAFEEDKDNLIELSDLFNALVKENGALHQLGMRYFEAMYSEEIYSNDYRTVLQVMAQNPTEYISRQEIIKKSGLKIHTVNNALSAMRKRNIVVAKSGEKGQYRLPSASFAAWIFAFKTAEKATTSGQVVAPDAQNEAPR